MPVSTSKVEAERLIEAKPEFHNFSASLSCRVRSCLKFTVLVFCVACSVAVIKYSDKNSLRERAFSSSQWRGLGWGVGDDRLSVADFKASVASKQRQRPVLNPLFSFYSDQ